MKNSLNKSFVWMTVMLLLLAGCAGTRTQQSTGDYVDDAAITAKVKSSLLADKEVSGLRIDVDTKKGVVHLGGTANTRHEANKAAELARGIGGVKSVHNGIRVQ